MDMRGSRSSSRRGSDSPAQGPAAEIAGAGLSRETRGPEEGGSPQWMHESHNVPSHDAPNPLLSTEPLVLARPQVLCPIQRQALALQETSLQGKTL